MGLPMSVLSHPELLFINLLILVFVFIFDSSLVFKEEFSQCIVYEKIELVKPDNRDRLIDNLQERTGLAIHRITINKVSFLRDTAEIVVYYRDWDRIKKSCWFIRR